MQSNIVIDPALRQQNHPSQSNTLSQGLPQRQYQESSHSNLAPSLQTPNFFGNNNVAQGSSEGQQSPVAPVHNPDDIKRPRACEACRQLKVKCEIDETSGTCKRCAKANRQCIITVPSKKRQKKTDSRVAELENKVEALTACLAARGQPAADTILDPAIAQQNFDQPNSYMPQWPGPPPSQTSPHVFKPTQVAGIKRQHADSSFGAELERARPVSSDQPQEDKRKQDVIDRGLVDVETAYRCFDRYVNDMAQRLPVVVFKVGTTAEEVRRNRPTLFQAIVAVACGTIRPDIQSKILSDAMKILAEKIVYTGEKSLELVQTIQVLTVFYQPPEKYEELNFNQLLHIAAVMALDIGLGKRTRKGRSPAWKGYKDKNKILPDPNTAETRRCWLGCYYMCSNSAMSLRRPLLVRWSPYAEECVELLLSAPDALPTDRWLCHIVQAQHIAEMIGTEFAMDDAAKELSLTDQNVQYHLKGLENELEKWHKAGEEFMSDPIMRHTKAIINLYMHEIAMHNEHNIDDFRPPYHSTPIEGPPDPESVTPIHIDSLTKCLRSCHAAFDAFLSMDTRTLWSLPTLFFVRTSYATVALIKLYSAIAAKESKYGAIFQSHELKVEYYLDELISAVTKVAEGGLSRVAYKFCLIFQMLRSWHVRRIENPNNLEQSQPRQTTATKQSSYPPGPAKQDMADLAQWRPPQKWGQPQVMQGRSGLQMLSDAAMEPPRQIQGQWISDPNMTGQNMQMPGQLDGEQMMIDPMMAATYGMPSDQMALMDFTSDELMAYGFGNEFLAMNFGFDQSSGWAMQ